VAHFPPEAPVAVLVDGHPLAAYRRAYLAGGRIFAPIAPLLTRLGDRAWLEGSTLVIQRAGRTVRIDLSGNASGRLDAVDVPVGPALRALGLAVRYDRARNALLVTVSRRAVVASPTPFDPAAPSVAPSAVFTPLVPPTPRPVWTGSPLPRRTALPFPPG